MKKVILPLVICVCVTTAFAQKKDKNAKTQPTTTTTTTTAAPVEMPKPEVKEHPNAKMIEHYYNKYTLASQWNDLVVAKDALYDLIIEYPGSDSLIFALGLYYYENEQLASSALIGQALLNRQPKSEQVLELVAASYEGLNIADRALQNYESLFLINNNALILYKMTFLQYNLKKYQEAMTNLDILMKRPEVETLKVQYADAAGKPKDYIIKVPLLNLKGMIYKEQKDNVNAKKSFEQALALAPDFVAAKQNLAAQKP